MEKTDFMVPTAACRVSARVDVKLVQTKKVVVVFVVVIVVVVVIVDSRRRWLSLSMFVVVDGCRR